MKCVNAVWELRNLGVNTIKIEVEKEDAPEKVVDMVEDFRRQYDAKYVVVKSNTRYPIEISLSLQDAGFWLIENQIHLKLTRESAIKALEEYKDFCTEISYKVADEEDLKLLDEEFKRGIFKKSEISLDPKFGMEIDKRRYSFWLKDILKQNGYIFLSLYEGKPIGFFTAVPRSDKKNEGLTSGIFNREKIENMGFFHALAGLKCFVDGEDKVSIFNISTNNLDNLRLQLSFGAKVTRIKNLFVKHYD